MKLSNTAKGYISLAIVDATWIASGYVAQIIFSVFGYTNSIAMAVYSVIFGLVLLMPLLWRKVDRRAFPSFWQVSTLGFLWLLGQLLYLMSLMYASVSTTTAISGTATAFAYLFSIILLGYSFRLLSAAGVLISVAGITLTAIFKAESDVNNNQAVHETVLGIILSIVAAVNSGIFTCLFKKWVNNDQDSGIVFGCFGFVGIVVGIPIIAICHFSGLQAFEVPDWKSAMLILADAFLCSVVCNYFFSKTFVFLAPVIVQVGLTLTIPVTFIITALILQTHSYPPWSIVGVVLIFLSVAAVSYDQAKYDQLLKDGRTNVGNRLNDDKEQISEIQTIQPRAISGGASGYHTS
jgi:drug/metabolite transporter (DMT)-like permease